ncbi:MAG TPA: response regulator transcription factor [Terriglobales bacterium]|nr:response regulator transcription factor [Terriglobales bacterium]
MIRVLAVADSAVVRAGLEAMLRESGRFEPIQANIPLRQLLALQSHCPADVVLAEVEDPSSLSLVVNNVVKNNDDQPNPPLVLLIDDVSRGELVRAFQIGVRGLLPRDAQAAEIFAAIEGAAAGLTVLASDEFDLLVPARSRTTDEYQTPIEQLSPRELEVLGLMSQGLANKNIADRLAVSEHTVKFHVSSILSKLAASSRTEAVTIGLREGLLII